MQTRAIIGALVILCSAPAAAAPPLLTEPLRKPTEASIRKVILNRHLHVSDAACLFEPDGVWTCIYPMGPYKPVGSWTLTGNVLEGHAKDPTSPAEAGIELELDIVAVSADGVLMADRDDGYGKKRVMYEAGPIGEAKKPILYDGSAGDVVQLVPGSTDHTLFREVIKGGERPSTTFFGPQAKTPRETSEIWYLDGFELDAWRLGSWLAPVLGSTEPRRWEWGGEYPLIVVTGSRKIVRETGQVVILVEGCEPPADCSDPLTRKVSEALHAAGWKVRAVRGSFSAPPRGVTYRAGMKEPVEKLVAGALSPWFKPTAVGARERGVRDTPEDCDAAVYLSRHLPRPAQAAQ